MAQLDRQDEKAKIAMDNAAISSVFGFNSELKHQRKNNWMVFDMFCESLDN